MSQLNAFVGHSFATDDREVVQAFLQYLDRLKAMDIGFTWESAEVAEPKELAEKVRRLMQDKNVFIGICTTREGVVDRRHVLRSWFNRNIIKFNKEGFSWKTSDWIIQEIGLAIGRDMEVILLVESGLRQPGGLQGNLEYIPFERNAPEKAFGKVLEMIQALRPKIKTVSVPEPRAPAKTEEEPKLEEEKRAEWVEPKDDWAEKDYDFALFRSIIAKNSEYEKKVTGAYFTSKEGQIPENRETWEARQEHLRIVFGEGGKLKHLEEIAAKYPGNSRVQAYLAMGYQHYEEHEKAAQSFMVAGEKARDERTRLTRYTQALIEYEGAGRKQEAQEVLKKAKALGSQVAGGEELISNALREVIDVQTNKDLFFGLLERYLQLRPDDVKARFTLAYNYSQADQNELSLYHYLKIPPQERDAITWNNLGVQSDQCDLASKSVEAYRTAEKLGETLAMSNLARKLIGAGFLDEAQEICARALQMKDYHKNVGYSIQRIKSIPDEENEKQKEILGKVTAVSEFYRAYGRAAIREQIAAHAGRWRGPDCEMQIAIDEGQFSAEGEYEVRRSRLGLALLGLASPPGPEIDRYRIKYLGEVYGSAVKCSVTREEVSSPAFLQSLSSQKDDSQALMVFLDDLSQIRVYEKRPGKEPSFYSLNRIV